MDIDFEEFLESGPKLTTIIILTTLLAVYASGFVIVNAYLSKYHIRQIDIFQPAFIQAGLLFVFVNSMAAVTAIATSYVLYNRLNSYPRTSNIQARSLVRVMTIAVFAVVLCELFTGLLTAFILKSTYRGDQAALFRDITMPLTIIMIVQGLSFFAVSHLIFNLNKLSAFFQATTLAVACLLFLFVETYSLLTIAENVYEKLPITVGGGQQQHVILFVDVENARYLDAIDNTFEEGTDLLINSKTIPPKENSSLQIQTNTLSLYWQLSSANMRTNDTEHAYYVRPYKCKACPVVKIPDTGVYGIIYLSDQDMEE